MPPSTQIKGWTGSFYIHRLRSSQGDFTFETPVGSVSINPDSQVRIDVLEEGPTTIAVRWGSAIVHTEDGDSIRIPTGKQVFIDPGYLPSSPTYFDRAEEDSFDTWNRERSRKLARGAKQVNIGNAGSYSTPIGTYDLNEYGEWFNTDNNYYWKPTVVNNYVPYRVGTWSYVPNHGHVWVGHHPFTYITSHHGYWSHHHRHGWIWSYNRRYSPAYVASVRYDDVFIWAPLSHHGDAVYLSGSYFTAGGFHFSVGFSSYSYNDHIYDGHHNTYSLNHHHHITDHHYYDAYQWNLYASTSHHYNHRPYRNHYSRARDYTPTRVIRGTAEARNGNRTYNARTRIAALESRSTRPTFSTGSTIGGSTRTSIRSSVRNANRRVVQFDTDPRERIAVRSERLRSTPSRQGTRPSIRTSAVNTLGQVRPIQPTRPTSSSSTTRPSVRSKSNSTRPNVRQQTIGSSQSVRPQTIGSQLNIRPQASTIRPVRPKTSTIRPSVRTQTTTTTPRPSVRPQSINVRPQVSTPQPTYQSQPSSPRPQTQVRPTPRPATPKPQVRSTPRPAPPRPSTTSSNSQSYGSSSQQVRPTPSAPPRSSSSSRGGRSSSSSGSRVGRR